VVICLERGADLHMAQLMPLPLTVSCFSRIQIIFAFLVPAHPGCPGQKAVKRGCVCIQWLDAVDQRCLCEESWTFAGTTLSEMPTSVALPTSHHFHPSLSPVVSLSLDILHEWMRTQMLAKPFLNLFQRTGGDHRSGRAQLG